MCCVLHANDSQLFVFETRKHCCVSHRRTWIGFHGLLSGALSSPGAEVLVVSVLRDTGHGWDRYSGELNDCSYSLLRWVAWLQLPATQVSFMSAVTRYSGELHDCSCSLLGVARTLACSSYWWSADECYGFVPTVFPKRRSATHTHTHTCVMELKYLPCIKHYQKLPFTLIRYVDSPVIAGQRESLHTNLFSN